MKKYFKTIYGLLCFLFIWWIFARFMNTSLLPTPDSTFINLINLFLFKSLALHLSVSFLRLLAGLISALLLGSALGLALGNIKLVDSLFSPVIYIIFPIPKVALLPVLFLFLGIGETSKIVLLFLIVSLQVTVSVRDTVKSIPVNYHSTAKVLRLSPIQKLHHVTLPCILSPIFSCMRISVGIGIAVLFFVENYATSWGIGYFIMNSWSLINYLDMYSGIVAMSMLGAASLALLDILERRFLGGFYD